MTADANPLETALSRLSQAQRECVDWRDGSLLVLAGPGSGKTQVLTSRIASLLEEGKDRSFRILALTFTNKAADEMKERVALFAPGLDERAVITTFHSFCGQVLRQHGVHIGIAADFAIFSLDADRKATLRDAMQRCRADGRDLDIDESRALAMIDRLKSRLVSTDRAPGVLTKVADADEVVLLYDAYEAELRHNNALDFNSLILEAYRLFNTFPAVAERYRRSYPYWLVDEFQDTTNAQYKLLREMAGDKFRNLFAVADDDQIIYQWNGASFQQIQRFRSDFAAQVLQLPTNYRCPPAIVEAANRLVAHNTQRSEAKAPLQVGKPHSVLPSSEQIQLRVFDTADEEAEGIAREIAALSIERRANTAVLARTRALLESIATALRALNVPSVLSQRRDDFLSPEVRFLVACLRQACRPLDRRNLAVLVEAFNRLGGLSISVPDVLAEAETTGESFGATWLRQVGPRGSSDPESANICLAAARAVFAEIGGAKGAVEHALDTLIRLAPKEDQSSVELREDAAVWKSLGREIARQIGSAAPLDQFLQELQLRSKEPPAPSTAVVLMTVHGSKGREFDFVFLVGLAEDQLPSYQSRQKGDDSPEMEEERRNCFVAITRAKEMLVLSRALRYRGWMKAPSRFLLEMGLG